MSVSNAPHARDLWAPRRQLSLEKARRRSDRVQWLRRFFVVGAALCAGVFGGHLMVNAIERSGSGILNVDAEDIVTMKNPRFSGRDDQGEAFIITADRAERQTQDQDKVVLFNPRIQDDFGGLVSAPQGLYDQKTQTLELWGNVTAAEPGGYVFSSSRARIYVQEGRVEGLNPLSGSGPIGDVEAASYEILEDGTVISMKGGVKWTLYPDGRPGEETEDKDASE